jgi:hypothetical protein
MAVLEALQRRRPCLRVKEVEGTANGAFVAWWGAPCGWWWFAFRPTSAAYLLLPAESLFWFRTVGIQLTFSSINSPFPNP